MSDGGRCREPTRRHDDEVAVDTVVVLVTVARSLDVAADAGPLGPVLRWMVSDRSGESFSALG